MPIVLYSHREGLGEGDPVTSLIGTGGGVPRGIEATFSFNNLMFNDLSVVDKYRVLSIDGLDDPDVRDAREDDPSADGETVQDMHYGGRTLAFNGRLESYNLFKLRDMQQAIRTAFIGKQELPLYFLTGNSDYDHYINCRKFSKLQWIEEQKDDNYFRDFLITLRASNPRFLRNSRKTATIDVGASEASVTLVNEGNFDAQPLIRIYGPITQPGIIDENNGSILQFKDSCTITDGDFYEIDYTRKGVSPVIKDSSGVNKFNQVNLVSDLFYFTEGTNIISLLEEGNSATGANSNMEFSYRDSWI